MGIAQAIKKKKKAGLHQNFKLLCIKGVYQERQSTELMKVHVNHISDKVTVLRIYTEFLQLNSKKTTQLKNVGKDLNRYFSKENIQMAN